MIRRIFLNLGAVRDWATVYVNGRKVCDLWCNPYECEVTDFLSGFGFGISA